LVPYLNQRALHDYRYRVWIREYNWAALYGDRGVALVQWLIGVFQWASRAQTQAFSIEKHL
jgi:hypothetical protein